jgi:hypothetical protein
LSVFGSDYAVALQPFLHALVVFFERGEVLHRR